MTNETTAPERIRAHAFWRGNQYYCRFSARDRSEKDFGQTEYVRADALEAAQARIAELEKVARLNASAWEMLSVVTDVPVSVTATALELGKGTRAALEGKG